VTCNGQALGNIPAIVKDHKPIAKAIATGQPEAMEMDLRRALPPRNIGICHDDPEYLTDQRHHIHT
jgi:hypothetical protein